MRRYWHPTSVEFGRHAKRKRPSGREENEDLKIQESMEKAREEEKNEGIDHHPLHIGKARADEPKEVQPEAAQLGIVPELSFRLLLSGPSASGKTNAARWLLDKYYKNTFDRIVLLSPTAEIDPVWKDLKGLKKKDRIHKLSMAPIRKILKQQEKKVKKLGKGKAPKILVIYDDTVGDNKIISSPEFLISFIRGRHFCVSCIVMTQSYMKIPRSVRLQATAVMVFPSFRSEIEKLYEEHGPYQLSRKEWYTMVMDAMKKTENEKYPFFMIDTTKPVENRYRRCLYDCIPIDPNRTPGSQSKKQKLNNDESAGTKGGEEDGSKLGSSSGAPV